MNVEIGPGIRHEKDRELTEEEERRIEAALDADVPYDVIRKRFRISEGRLKALIRGEEKPKRTPTPIPEKCAKGHEYTKGETYWKVNYYGQKVRMCRQCALDRAKRLRERRK